MKAEDLVRYFDSTRSAGHTTVTFSGLSNHKGKACYMHVTVASATAEIKKRGLSTKEVKPLSIYCDAQSILGLRYPLIIDHCAFVELVNMLIYEKSQLEKLLSINPKIVK